MTAFSEPLGQATHGAPGTGRARSNLIQGHTGRQWTARNGGGRSATAHCERGQGRRGCWKGYAQRSPSIGCREEGSRVPAWQIRGSDSFEVHSDAVGDDFAIGVVPPVQAASISGAAPETKPEVVYLLDGVLLLPVASVLAQLQRADLIRPGFPPLLLVGIDYPDGKPNCRSRDYTMPDSVPTPMAELLEASPNTRPGGAKAFLHFLEDELDPLIRERYPVADGPGGLFGDSFGGTFAFYAFLRQSRLFDRYWLGSPGLFTTASDYVGQIDQVLKGELVHRTRMFLSLGELEATGPVDFYRDLGANFERLVKSLDSAANPRLTFEHRVYAGHTHVSVPIPALADALIALYARMAVPAG